MDVRAMAGARHLVIAGVGVMATGLVKLGFHLSALGLSPLTFCGEQGFSASHLVYAGDVAFAVAPHCWGCTAITLGAALALAAVPLAWVRRAPLSSGRHLAA